MASRIIQQNVYPEHSEGAQITLNICHLYPDLMDTYGDKGNIITIKKRCEWRGIEVKVSGASVNEPLPDADLFFFGGGQDRQQIIVGQDLQKKARDLKKSVESGSVLLSICGGYQLLQNYFKTIDGVEIKGIGLFDAHTQGSTQRMIGNLLISLSSNMKSEVQALYTDLSLRGTERRSNLNSRDRFASLAMTEGIDNLIGFENHSGKTYMGKTLKPLGTVIKGFGNNGEDKTEGAIYKNAFGCYLHGSLLPKNPHFADYLIAKALERKYGKIKLESLDDSIEWEAHETAIKLD